MNDELKSLIEDAAALLGISDEVFWSEIHDCMFFTARYNSGSEFQADAVFNPLDPERGDLMKVAEAAGLSIEFDLGLVFSNTGKHDNFQFTKGDHPSKVLAILRAASAVYKSRGGV